MVFPHHAVSLCPQSNDNIAQGPVVHVLTPFPQHLPRVDAQGISLLDVVVQESGQQIIG